MKKLLVFILGVKLLVSDCKHRFIFFRPSITGFAPDFLVFLAEVKSLTTFCGGMNKMLKTFSCQLSSPTSWGQHCWIRRRNWKTEFVEVLQTLFLSCPARKAMEEGVEGRGPRIAEVTLLCKQRLEEEDCRSRQGRTVRNGELMD